MAPDLQPPPPPLPPAPPHTEGGEARARTPDGEDHPGLALGGVRLAGLIGVLVLVGLWRPWMLVVILAIVLMITLHELGHFLTAKRAGMKVTEFFLGFGPKIWSTRRGETEYGIKVIPAGAYVKIIGMSNLDEVPAADEERTYRQKGFGQRLSVAVAGSAMHFLLALILLYVALVAVGQPGGRIVSSIGKRAAVVDEAYPGSGAAGKLRAGDRIVSIDGVATPTVDDLHDQIDKAKRRTAASESGKPATVSVEVVRNGARVAVPVEVKAYEVDHAAACGLGIRMTAPPNERTGALQGLVDAPREFGNVLWFSLQGLGRFFSPSGVTDFARQVGSARNDRQATEDRKEQSQTDPCAADASAASTGGSSSGGGGEGQNRILSIVGLVGFGSDLGAADPAALISLFALINIFIGVFNLVPLLPFDGGHVAVAIYEKIQEKRLKRRRYFTDMSRLLPITYGVVIVLGMLFLSSLYLDLVNPIGG
jgi:membrane-associated protease RseP (regulator of RpoE activity)